MGIKFPFKKLSTIRATGTENKLEKQPIIAAPSPAISPSGCMAMAFKFPNKIPTKKNPTNITAIVRTRGGSPS